MSTHSSGEHHPVSPTHRMENPERLLTMSDGVFAIAITLLVLEFRVPNLIDDISSSSLAHAVWDLKSSFLAYFVSFVVIAVYWDGHRRFFSHISRIDSTLVRLNFALLFFIGLFPFPTAVLARYSDLFFAVAFYAGFHVLIGVISIGLRVYATRRHLVETTLSPTTMRKWLLNAVLTLAVFLVSIPVALASPEAATICWIAIAFTSIAAKKMAPRIRALDLIK
jgi:uncharacterized membrane protein